MITQADNLLLQSYYSVSLLVELKNNEFLESRYFDEMSFRAPWIKEGLQTIGIDNQGSLLMSLYAMLVIPKELIFDKYCHQVSNVQTFLKATSNVTKNDYQTPKDAIDFLRHIRNSVSHASVEFDPGNTVTFIDKNPKSKKMIHIQIPLNSVGELLAKLQEIHLQYIRDNQST
jgi:hypothetical protein